MIEPIDDFASWLNGQAITRKIDSLVLHHTYRPTTRQYEGERTIAAIRKYHLSKGWRDIGYHLLVGPEGAIWPGRPLDWPGAHALVQKPEMVKFFGSAGYLNKFSVGVCAIGDYDTEQPSAPLVGALRAVLCALARRFLRGEGSGDRGQGGGDNLPVPSSLTPHPSPRLFFHRQVTAKSCPGRNFDLETVRSWLAVSIAELLKPEPVIAAWALDSWRWVQTKGLIFGEPDSPVDRQALATVLYRYDRAAASLRRDHR